MVRNIQLPMHPRDAFVLAVAVALLLGPGPTRAADIVLTPPAAGGVSVTNAAGDVTQFRVAEDGSVAIPGAIFKGANSFIHSFGVTNTFIGESAGNFTTTGHGNTAVGANALGSNQTGVANGAYGVSALGSNTSGLGNVALGHFALFNNTTGSNNIAIGNVAGNNLTSGSQNIHIGHSGFAGEGTTTRIGNGQSRAFISSIRGITTGSANAIPVMIDSSGQLGTVSSSARFKDDIADMGEASDALMNLRPVTFFYKTDQDPAGRTLQYGLVAEEVAQVYPGLVAHSPDGQVETVMYQFLPAMLLNESQKQRGTIERLEAELAGMQDLRNELAAIKRQLGLR